ncbi:MAG: RNA polymerase sigma factor (sigma-70 family) [Paraglaciecola sp.]|jgi:RNA polymerase sigma factor (sigma-70 family)
MQPDMPEHTIMHQIFMTARGSITRLVSRLVPPKEVEDIVQETYVKICQLDKYDEIQRPKSFLFKTARNLAIDHLKKAETRLADGAEDECSFNPVSSSPQCDEIFEQAASNEEFSHFCEAVRQLPVQCRRVFVLKKVYGYSQKEIAAETNLSESTVEKHIALGLKRCTSYMHKVNQPHRSIDARRLSKNTEVQS